MGNVRIIQKDMPYGGVIEIPAGFKLFNTVEKISNSGTNGFFSSTSCILIEDEAFETTVERLKIDSEAKIQKALERLEAEYDKKLKKLNLYQAFSDLISRFKIGDQVFYYQEYTSHKDDDEIEHHIYSKKIHSISLTENNVIINESDNLGYANYKPMFSFFSESKYDAKINAEDVYNSKEDAIIGSQKKHDIAMQLKNKDKK